MSKASKKPSNGRGGRRAGAGRKTDPVVGRRENLGVSLPAVLIEQLRAACECEEVAISERVELFVRQGLGWPESGLPRGVRPKI